ncbi:BTAD domain-containing putative transcriptional regulator [Marinithermus hydrothermalis]|uniref:PAS/PAC sensor protein n=1 Tax=Marinithermus hydrothermalis (strain DSM 14884 / JCM 11576 / T1) TaxID=869210 RepID=F2NR04_MARHT|nr:BTAD domain-containing putative transcriptional regulator [Marinithermus hydrothermalis]AEB12582.1 putative PAS/PAC sensor protein [Marinithermus hydrothermalis DSM 14884]
MGSMAWRLDWEGRILQITPEGAERLGFRVEEALGRRCAEVTQGTDAFGRPLCARCPVLRELGQGAYEASTTVTVRGRRFRCRAVAHEAIEVEFSPSRHPDPSEVLSSLAWAVRYLTATPERFFQTLGVFLGVVRRAARMEAVELFLADPKQRYLGLTAHEGAHPSAFFEQPWFTFGNGYPGIVALERTPIVTHELGRDPRYLRRKVKALGYATYISYPLELPHGLIGVLNLASRDAARDEREALELLERIAPLLASGLYTVLTRLGEAQLLSALQALRRGQEGAGLQALLEQTARFAQARFVILRTRAGQQFASREVRQAACPHLETCPVWEGRLLTVRGVGAACPHVRSGALRYCIPVWSGEEVVAVESVYFARSPAPPTAPLVPLMWLERLALEALTTPKPAVAAAPEAPWLEIETLGRFVVRRAGRVLSPRDFGRRKAWQLLKILVAHWKRPLHREELAERLWPEAPPEQAVRHLHVLVHALRKGLEPDPRSPRVIKSEGETYRFDPEVPYFLDVERFETLVREGDRKEGPAALEAYRQALELYRGEFMAEEVYSDWCDLDRSYYREQAQRALAGTAEILERLGRAREAIAAYRRMLTLDPWREEAYRGLLRILVREGERAEARAVFEAYRRHMRQEGLPVDEALAQLVEVGA